MTLSKKYYKVFAQMLGEAESLHEFQEMLVDYMANENERFDQSRFYQAIGEARFAKKQQTVQASQQS